MLSITPIKFVAARCSVNSNDNAKDFAIQLNAEHSSMNILAQQNKATVNFRSGFFRTPKGSQDHNITKWIEQAKLGNDTPLLGYLRGEQITATAKLKETIQRALDLTPKSEGGAIDSFQEALEVIEEKLKSKSSISFRGGFYTTPKGSQDHNLAKWIEQATLGNDTPLIGYLRGEQITTTAKVKETIQQALDATPKRRGGVIDAFQEALEVIEEKLKGKK